MDQLDVIEQNQFENLILGLINNEYGCCDNFITAHNTLGLLANINALNLAGNMVNAGIGNQITFQQNKKIRGDKINWIATQSTNEFEVIYLKKIERFMLYLNKTCFTALTAFESHYASYEKNSFYKRHIDQFKNQSGRQYSIILYLNQDWQEKDGGMLSLYPANKTQINILPLAGRLVLFKSDTMPHEVHPSLTRTRHSIAAWLKN